MEEYKHIDKSDMYSVMNDFRKQCEEAIELTGDFSVMEEVERIVVAGMGGSAISGDVMSKLTDIPVEVVRDYDLPGYVDMKTLVFVMSYSGNTEETVSMYRAALKKRAKILTITSGGKLEELSGMNGTDVILIPGGLQPRVAIAYMLMPMLKVLVNSKMADLDLSSAVKNLNRDVFADMGMDLARKIDKKIPIVYASPRFEAAARRWKTQFNENAKIHSFYGVFPEFNHNEIVGYSALNAEYYAIFIRDEQEHPQVEKRMKIVKKLIKESGVSVTELVVKGDTFLTRLLSAIRIGDWTSYYTALFAERDPTPVTIIEKLKEMLR